MAKHIYGIHDAGGEHLMTEAGTPGWVVVTKEVADGGKDYRHLSEQGLGVIVRLNYSHHGQGTIPQPDKYDEFAEACADYVAASRGCTRWIIGNEPNHEQERPDGRPIFAAEYAECFLHCWHAIREAAGTQQQVIPAAIAPWNDQTGDWLRYFEDVLQVLAGRHDGLALHTYTHGPEPGLISSADTMKDEPYTDRLYEFRAYQEFLARVPPGLRHLPVYITETNQTVPWLDAANGWVPAAYQEIDAWNQRKATQKIHALCLYRWVDHDMWSFKDKPRVHEDFKRAMAEGYEVPKSLTQGDYPGVKPEPSKVHLPLLGSPSEDGPEPDKFAATMQFILRMEGGYTADDEGHPANYGINQGANPDIDVENLTLDEALQIYRARYWQASGAHELPWPGCLLLMDASVQHGVYRSRALWDKAAGDLTLFQGIRQEFYWEIAQNDPAKWERNGAAWMWRMAMLLQRSSQGMKEKAPAS